MIDLTGHVGEPARQIFFEQACHEAVDVAIVLGIVGVLVTLVPGVPECIKLQENTRKEDEMHDKFDSWRCNFLTQTGILKRP